MGLEARSAAWDVEREIDREAPAGAPSGTAGARADFLANLGRRVAELLSMLVALKDEPASARLRDDLRRRLHALGAGARLLRFDRLAAEVASTEEILAEVAGEGALSEAHATSLRAAIGKLAGLGWTANETAVDSARGVSGRGDAARRPGLPGGTLVGVGALHPPVLRGASAADAASSSMPANPWPLSVLVVGPKAIADALVVPTAEGAATIDVERSEDGLGAIDLARAVAPDVIVLDADRPGARELLDAIRKDPLTASAAVVAIGGWSRAEEATAFLSAGAARAVHKPVSPDALRRVCREAAADRDSGAPAIDLGLVSLPELAARLGKEVERAVVDGALMEADGTRVDLGGGEEVLGAMWSAAARVRDLVTIKSRGGIRFKPGAAERAIPVGAWMNDAPGAAPPARRGGVRANLASAKPLAGARVLVADDDPAVAWFLAGVLRAEGATVTEACDGATALRKAMEQSPDMVLTDVLMPNLDGLSLTEVLRADPILSDVAVVLLSWKDDLLQRARELGSRADAYLRKDASGPTVAARVRELYYPKARLAERIAAGGEVHGRVDGLTMRTLLRLVCAHRPSCVVEVRDAAYLYEIVIDGGRPTNVTRTAKEGPLVSGSGALARLLGVRAGRFVIAPTRDGGARAATLSGSLDELIRPLVASARGAARVLLGSQIAAVTKVALDDEWQSGYGALAPEPARAVVRRLGAGEAPRKVLASGVGSARLFEEVVRDACARGAVTAILGAQGEDLLGSATAAEMDLLLGTKPASVAPPAPASEPATDDVSPSGVIVAPAGIAEEAVAPAPGLLASAAAEDIVARGVPTSLPPSVAPPIVAPSASPSVDSIELSAPPLPSRPAMEGPLVTLGSLTPPPAAPKIEPDPPRAPVISVSGDDTTARRAEAPSRRPHEDDRPARKPHEDDRVSRRGRGEDEDDESPPPRRAKHRDTRASRTPEAPPVKPNSRMGLWIMCAVAGVVFAVGARISQERRATGNATPEPPPPAVTAAAATTAAPTAAPSAAPAAPTITVPGEAPSDPILPQEAPLRSDEKVPSGQGILEVVVGPSDEVSIDGKPTVAGPVVKATLAPREKPYEIRVKMRGEERTRYALVKEGKRTRVRIAPPWNR
ncbi:MAG: response regulator [Polyangiaceae bacterium]